MGLDMYLKATRFVSGYDFNPDESYGKLLDLFDARELASKDTPSAEVSVTVGYWRKANAIHQWFVDNCQEGIDDCRSAYVGREQLQELRDTCQAVLDAVELKEAPVHVGTRMSPGEGLVEEFQTGQVVANPEVAKELLPTQSGFFFGGTDYDEHYVLDCQDTVKQLDKVLAFPPEWDFEYRSSW